MRVKHALIGTLAVATLGVVGFLAWAQQRDVAALKIPPGKAGARAAARVYAAGPHASAAFDDRAPKAAAQHTFWAARSLVTLIGIIAICVLAFLVHAWHSEIAAIEPPSRDAFDPALIERGAQLAVIGNCNVCHTRQDGVPYAGGRPLTTPFGTIHGSNITPDLETGIGTWSEAAFRRAMHEGVDRGGRHLYPAFPYDHFTRVTDDDVKAIYAFLMTRNPVRATTPANDLSFPLNFRISIAGWKLLFFDRGEVPPTADQNAQWSRGKYLADGLAHCGACHTPRNRLGAERKRQYFAGGDSENWTAPALNASSPAPVPWTEDSVFAYLRQGQHEEHGAVAGPMAPVAANLARVPESDVRAIAVYVASVLGESPPERQRKARELIATRPSRETVGSAPAEGADPGATIYAGACVSCHSGAQRSRAASGLPLALSTALSAPDPRNAIHLILDGVHPQDAQRGALMPGFATALTDSQVTDLIAYLRKRFSTRPAWADVAAQVRAIRHGGKGS